MSDTKSRILETALRLFNERGLHSVGVREIARELEMSPGNLQYHFKRKDDLIAALFERMHQENSRLMASARGADMSFGVLAELGLTIMRHHLTFRSVMLSYASFVAHSPRLRVLERDLVVKRRARWDRMVDDLVDAKLVSRAKIDRVADDLFEQSNYLGRTWLLTAVLTQEPDELEKAAAHHLRLSLQLWESVATPAGVRQLEPLLER